MCRQCGARVEVARSQASKAFGADDLLGRALSMTRPEVESREAYPSLSECEQPQ